MIHPMEKSSLTLLIPMVAAHWARPTVRGRLSLGELWTTTRSENLVMEKMGRSRGDFGYPLSIVVNSGK